MRKDKFLSCRQLALDFRIRCFFAIGRPLLFQIGIGGGCVEAARNPLRQEGVHVEVGAMVRIDSSSDATRSAGRFAVASVDEISLNM